MTEGALPRLLVLDDWDTARGVIVNDDALVDVLRTRPIAAGGDPT